MTYIVLSFCIPTYNRPERIAILINQVISLASDEIEIVIGDDNPSSDRTQQVVIQFKDPRIKYFRNKKNLGMDGNILKTINRASGEFVFIMMDDDDIEMKSIPWVIKMIKENRNLSQLCGAIGHKNPTYRTRDYPYYFKFKLGDRILSRGTESIKNLIFYYPHGSGIILRKNTLNLKKSIKYCGFLWIQQALIAQAMLKGDTLCSSKIFAHIGEINYGSNQPLFKGKQWWHHVYNIYQTKVRIQIILDLTNGMNGLRNILINRQIGHLSRFFFYIFYLYRKSFTFIESLKSLIEGLGILFTIKASKTVKFWFNLIIGVFIIYTKNNKYQKLYRFLSKK